MLIHAASRGIPRTINVLCDNALISGFALGCQPVGRDIVAEVCRDFDIAPDELMAPLRPQPLHPAMVERLPRSG
jgi:general secretion pathway protein A